MPDAVALTPVVASAAPATTGRGAGAPAPDKPGAFADAFADARTQELERAADAGPGECAAPENAAAAGADASGEAADAQAAQAAAADLAALLAGLQPLQPVAAEAAAVGLVEIDDSADTPADRDPAPGLPAADAAAAAVAAAAPLPLQAGLDMPPLPTGAALPGAASPPTPAVGHGRGERDAQAQLLAGKPEAQGQAVAAPSGKPLQRMPFDEAADAATPGSAAAASATGAPAEPENTRIRHDGRQTTLAEVRQSAETPAAAATALAAATLRAAPGAFAGPTVGAGGAATFEAALNAALGTPEFAPALGTQVSMLVRDGISQARLHLHPAELGPIAVRIELDGRSARVDMSAEHALTRQALEQALPSLASALRESGLTLTGGGVFQQPRQPQQDLPRPAPALRGAPPDHGAEAPLGPAAARARMQRGAVDLYA